MLIRERKKCLNREGRCWLDAEREEIEKFILDRESINEEREITEWTLLQREIDVMDVVERVCRQRGIVFISLVGVHKP